MRILLVTPPMLQFNAPYPATPYLAGYLKAKGYSVTQWDASLDLVLNLFSRAGFLRWSSAFKAVSKKAKSVQHIITHQELIADRVENVIRFLQGKDPSLAYRINTRQFLPEGPRFRMLKTDDLLEDAFGSFTLQDRAKFLASLFLDDLADAIKEGIDPNFELAKYGEKLTSCQPSLDALWNAVHSEPSVIDQMMLENFRARVEKEIAANSVDLKNADSPLVIGWSVPFPGNLYAAARMAAFTRKNFPDSITLLGGGYINTELRKITDARLFEWFHYVTLDDGERPIGMHTGSHSIEN